MPTQERARAKHNDLVNQLAKVNTKIDKLLDALTRWQNKKTALVRAVVRSGKRLDKLALATHTAGPTASPVPAVIAAVEVKPAEVIDDGIPPEFRRTKEAVSPPRQFPERELAQSSAEAQQLSDELVERKKAKSRGRVAKMLAKKSGATKAMPLSGKDALKFIDGQ